MTKRTPPPPPKRQPAASPAPQQSHAAAIRETIESVAIAFVLAFLFRTFEAEAFVIPTGSMAPTLMGRHKDLECPECHYKFQAGASEEVNRDGSERYSEREELVDGRVRKVRSTREFKVDLCTCPMCRYTWRTKPGDNDGPLEESSFNGDRILVNKFAYQFNEPKRWDVIVFKFPKGAQENYIKRLIGLPNETIRIHRGGIWTMQPDGSFEIARKPAEKLQVMLQPVFDNDLMPKMAKDCGLPVRWRPQKPLDGGKTGQWTSTDHAVYETDGSAAGETWLRYEHRVPTPTQWKNASESRLSDGELIKPQLITDFTPYDSSSSQFERERHQDEPTGLNWTGDLAFRCQVDVAGDKGQIVMELVEGGRRFQCRLDVATGLAQLSIVGDDCTEFKPQAQTAVRGPGKYELMFANCDQKLYLWIDGKEIAFDAPTEYADLHNECPTRADLQPAGIASSGVKMKIEHLMLFRDIYYIATDEQIKKEHYTNRIFSMIDLREIPRINPDEQPRIASVEDYLARFFSDPDLWGDAFIEKNMEETEKKCLSADEFFAMGDNSAKSADSRFWGTVPRDLLIGKAFFVYWPHSWHRIPATKVPFPFFPNFTRMGFVR
jgi:signal peptidase I